MKTCCKCRQAKPPEAFARNRAKKDGLQERCKDCCKFHYHTSGYTVRQRELALKKKYNLTPEAYESMASLQEFSCAICGDNTSKLHVDHNHTTGKVRGLLCNNCNRAIGLLKDDVQVLLKAAEYIENDGIRSCQQPTTL
jgi:hypothetical protein